MQSSKEIFFTFNQSTEGSASCAEIVRAAEIKENLEKLKQFQQNGCPFVDLPTEGSSRWGGGVSVGDMKEIIWTKPELVAQIQFVEWTAENRLRHSKFLGLRSDKVAKDVHRER